MPAHVDDPFDDGEKFERRARQSINVRHNHLIARCNGFDELAEFFAVNLRAGHLLAIDARAPRRLELFKLGFGLA